MDLFCDFRKGSAGMRKNKTTTKQMSSLTEKKKTLLSIAQTLLPFNLHVG